MTTIEIIKPRACINAIPPGIRFEVSIYINGDGRPAWLIKMAPQGANPKALMLEILYKHEVGVMKNPQQITYIDILKSIDDYEKVEIWFKGDKLVEIDEISITQ